MKRALPLLLAPLVLGAVSCTATLSVDGFDAEYASAPTEIDRYPRYSYRGTQVYEVHGRYYRRYGDRWVVYRRAPPDLRRDDDRGHRR